MTVATDAIRRRINSEKDAQLAAVILEAVAEYLAKR